MFYVIACKYTHFFSNKQAKCLINSGTHKKHGTLEYSKVPCPVVSQYRDRLIVTIALHLADMTGEADHLVAVAELVVVPQI